MYATINLVSAFFSSLNFFSADVGFPLPDSITDTGKVKKNVVKLTVSATPTIPQLTTLELALQALASLIPITRPMLECKPRIPKGEVSPYFTKNGTIPMLHYVCLCCVAGQLPLPKMADSLVAAANEYLGKIEAIVPLPTLPDSLAERNTLPTNGKKTSKV